MPVLPKLAQEAFSSKTPYSDGYDFTNIGYGAIYWTIEDNNQGEINHGNQKFSETPSHPEGD